VCCGTINSCQSAATFEIVKTLLARSSSHVRSAIASTRLYLYLYRSHGHSRRHHSSAAQQGAGGPGSTVSYRPTVARPGARFKEGSKPHPTSYAKP